jgi:hypothetical protein
MDNELSSCVTFFISGGDGEIRTRGTQNVRRLSKALVSATHPRLQAEYQYKFKSLDFLVKKMAEVEGFEPPDGANRQQFSKLPPSTTRTHFQKT